MDSDTGEDLPKANDELDGALLKNWLMPGAGPALDTRTRHGWPYFRNTLRIDKTVDEFAARFDIYRMMRPGEPPTEDAVQALFQRCSSTTLIPMTFRAVGR